MSTFFFVFSTCMMYTFFENLACLNDAYGDDCEYTCGHCFNNASCDTRDGTCLNGCEKGYRGSDCKQRKCFTTFYRCIKNINIPIFMYFNRSLVHVGVEL